MERTRERRGEERERLDHWQTRGPAVVIKPHPRNRGWSRSGTLLIIDDNDIAIDGGGVGGRAFIIAIIIDDDDGVYRRRRITGTGSGTAGGSAGESWLAHLCRSLGQWSELGREEESGGKGYRWLSVVGAPVAISNRTFAAVRARVAAGAAIAVGAAGRFRDAGDCGCG